MYLRPLLHNLRRNTCSQLSLMCCNPPMYIRPVVISSTSTHSANKVRLASSTSTIQPTNNAEEIYYGTLTPKIRAVKVFSLTTSVVGVSIQPMLIEQGTKLGGMPMVVFMCGFAGLFTFVTPVLLHFVTKKYVTHITYNSANDEYTATTISLLLLKKQHVFKASDVHVPDVTGMFTTFKVKDKALFVDISQFTDTSHYARMMGYDKPIDFKFDLAHSKEVGDQGKKL